MAALIQQVRMTALMRTHSDPSKATFIFAHPFLLEKSGTLISPKFKSKNSPHSFFRVVFRVSDAARVILTMMPFTQEASYKETIESFISQYGTALITENANFLDKSKGLGIWEHSYFKDQMSKYEARISGTSKVVEELEKIETPEAVEMKAGIKKVYDGYWLRNTFVTNENYLAFDLSLSVSKKEAVNILMIGPSGYGKTSIPEAFAEIHDMNFFRMNCAQVRDPEEWFGYREARDGNTVFIPSEFTKAVTKGNCVIVLDEFNRVEPWLHNTLYPLLDHARETIVHGETIKVGPNVVFVATANIGYQYVGSFQLDTAIMNRMDLTLKVGPLPRLVEIQLLQEKHSLSITEAKKVVDIISDLRDLADQGKISCDVSTRTSLKIAKFVNASDISLLADIVKNIILNNLSAQESKIAIDTISSKLL